MPCFGLLPDLVAKLRPILTDRGERRLYAGRDMKIIEADEREILRNAVAHLLYGFHHADSQQIGGNDERLGQLLPRVVLQKLLHIAQPFPK